MCRTFSLLACLACLPGFGAVAGNFRVPASLTVVLDIQNHHYSPNSLSTMKAETERILSGAGLKLDWRTKQDVPAHAEFSNVVVFTLTGSCSMEESPVLIDERGPLALTYTSNGDVLPFGEVRCDRVRASLRRSARLAAFPRWDSLLGVALGRVMAHELYHMLTEETHHTDEGVTRTSLRTDDLIGGRLNLDPAALSKITARLRNTKSAK
jgi:hypothetical protein